MFIYHTKTEKKALPRFVDDCPFPFPFTFSRLNGVDGGDGGGSGSTVLEGSGFFLTFLLADRGFDLSNIENNNL